MKLSDLCSSSPGQIENANELRLDAFDRAGIPVMVDGRAVLGFLFNRTLGASTAREFRRSWVVSVAGLLDDIECRVSRTRLDIVHDRLDALHRTSFAESA